MLHGVSYLHVNEHHVTQLLRCMACPTYMSMNTTWLSCSAAVQYRHTQILEVTILPSKFPFHMGDLARHLTHGSWSHPSLQPKWHLNRFSHFCTAHGRVSLYFTMDRPFPHSKLPLPTGDLDPSWFFRPTWDQNPNDISISWSVFLGLTNVTDRQTDRQTTLLGL